MDEKFDNQPVSIGPEFNELENKWDIWIWNNIANY